MKITHFKVEDVFGDVISKDSISAEQITKLYSFLAKKMRILVKILNSIFLKIERKTMLIINRVLLPIIDKILLT